jgi:hypothetical protein
MILHRNFFEQGMAALAGPAIMSGTPAPGNLIDAHVHVWTNDFSKYPLAWLHAGKDEAAGFLAPGDTPSRHTQRGRSDRSDPDELLPL